MSPVVPGGSNDVTDIADDGDDSDGNTTNDPTIVFTTTDSSIEVTKTNTLVDTNGDGATNAGDVIVYNITVQNTGNTLLTGVGIVDTLTDGNGLALSLQVVLRLSLQVQVHLKVHHCK